MPSVLDTIKKQFQKPAEQSKGDQPSSELPVIVFPEGKTLNVIKAASLLAQRHKCTPVLLGNKKEIDAAALSGKINLSGVIIRDPAADDAFEELGVELYEANEDSMDLTKAKELALEPSYFGFLLLKAGLAQGLVMGASTSMGGIFKPVRHVFPEEWPLVSSFHVLSKGNYTVIFADCAMSVNPPAERLADIAKATAESASKMALNPKVALVSFSTKGSSQQPEAQKVRDACTRLKEIGGGIVFEGELQFDVAANPDVAKRRFPEWKGDANVFIFPDLNSGNISLKVAEQFGQFEVLGPFTQGLPSHLGTVTENCSPDEIYRTAQVLILLSEKRLNTKESPKK